MDEYKEYKVTWAATRNPQSETLQLAEVEIPGLLGTAPSLPNLDYPGDYVASITHGADTSITLLGGVSSGAALDQRSLDGTTNKFVMYPDSSGPGWCSQN